MNAVLEIKPIPHVLNAAVRVPGSKSLTNRALLIAALAQGTTRLTNALFSDDSRYFAGALQALGFEVRLDEARQTMTVTGLGGKIPARQAELFVGNAGTAAVYANLSNGRRAHDEQHRFHVPRPGTARPPGRGRSA